MQTEPTSTQVQDPGIRRLFSEESRFQAWLDVEAALAEAQAELGVIPRAAADEISLKASCPTWTWTPSVRDSHVRGTGWCH